MDDPNPPNPDVKKKKKKKKKPTKKEDFKQFDLSAPPEDGFDPNLVCTEIPPGEKAGSVDESYKKNPPVRNPESEVDMGVPNTPKPPEGPQPGKKGKFALTTSSGDESRPKTADRRPLTKAAASQKLREEVDEVAIHKFALNNQFTELENLIGLRGLKDDQGKNYIRFLDSRDAHGNTALMNAAWKGHTFAAEFLIKSGADKDLQNYYGWTAAMWAAANGHLDTIKMLIKHGVDLTIHTPVNRTALDFADDPEIEKCIRDIVDKPIKYDEDEEEKDGKKKKKKGAKGRLQISEDI